MICEICEAEKAVITCKRCGRAVCEKHYNKDLEICKVCELTLCYICRRRSAVMVCAVCGRPICEKDSSRIGLYRVCNYCLQQQHRQ